jgi:hypothetical protein
LEFYRNELSIISEAKRLESERLGMKTLESKEKDEKLIIMDKRLDDMGKVNSALLESKLALEKRLFEMVSKF